MRRRRTNIRAEILKAFQLAATEWERVAIHAIARHVSREVKRSAASSKSLSDPRIDLALRHRVLSAALVPHEVEILIAAIDGTPRADIGRALGVGENTLKTHVRVLLRKLGVTSLQEAVIEVLRAALEASHPTSGSLARVLAELRDDARRRASQPNPPVPALRPPRGPSANPIIALLHAHRGDGLGAEEIRERIGGSKKLIALMLRFLVRTGKVKRAGNRRETRYVLASSSTAGAAQTMIASEPLSGVIAARGTADAPSASEH